MRQLFFIFLFVFLVAGALYWFLYFPNNFLAQNEGRLSVRTAQARVTVFLNGNRLGETPFYSKDLKSGDYALTLKKGQVSWETKVTLTANTLSLVEADLSIVADFSSASVLHYSRGQSSLIIFTKPSKAQVFLDGQEKKDSLEKLFPAEGEHTLLIKKPGYLPREVVLTIEDGYNLNTQIYLAIDPFDQTKKLDGGSKISLFSLYNSVADLSKSYSDWVEGVKHTQESFSGGQTRFDVLIDAAGKSYVLYPTEWANKVSTKAVTNIGYLASDSSGQISDLAKSSWESLKKQFN